MKNVPFKALLNKSTLERCLLSPKDYCIMASRKNLHLPELYPLKLCLLELKNKHIFLPLFTLFWPKDQFRLWKLKNSTQLKQRYREGSVPFQQATFSQSHWSGTILSVFVLNLVAILWSQVQHSSECLTRVTILDSWKIGVKKIVLKYGHKVALPHLMIFFKRSARLSFLPWRILLELSLWI